MPSGTVRTFLFTGRPEYGFARDAFQNSMIFYRCSRGILLQLYSMINVYSSYLFTYTGTTSIQTEASNLCFYSAAGSVGPHILKIQYDRVLRELQATGYDFAALRHEQQRLQKDRYEATLVRLLESLIMIFLACYTIYRPHVSYLFFFHLSLVIHDL